MVKMSIDMHTRSRKLQANISRFKEMVKTLKPRYALPASTHFSQIEMPKQYGKVRKQVEKQIHTIKHQCISEMEVN